MLEVDKAYAAGFFDGEGHVRCDIIKGYPHLLATVSQVDEQPLVWLQTLFGGIVRRQTNKYNGIYCWQVYTLEAQRFLETVLPHLMVKRVDTEEALAKWRERNE